MNSYTITLREADDIEEFYLSTTGMKPDFLQLSRGPVDLMHHVDELGGVTLVWTRAHGRTRWRDEMTGGALQLGFAIESAGPIIARGNTVTDCDVQVWVAGKEMDYIMNGPLRSLEIGVDSRLVETLGWRVGGEPLRKVPAIHLQRLLRTCDQAARAVRGTTLSAAQPGETRASGLWRDAVLDAMEPVLTPWLVDPDCGSRPAASNTSQFDLIKRADDFFDALECDSSFQVDSLAQSLGVSRRTLFHAYRKLLGMGPRRYLEVKRLHVLRSRLRSAPADATVTSIATDLGFTNLGRLAALYRDQFGENPSHTITPS